MSGLGVPSCVLLPSISNFVNCASIVFSRVTSAPCPVTCGSWSITFCWFATFCLNTSNSVSVTSPSSPFVIVNVVVFPFVYVIVYVSTNPTVPVFVIVAIPFPVAPTLPVSPLLSVVLLCLL